MAQDTPQALPPFGILDVDSQRRPITYAVMSLSLQTTHLGHDLYLIDAGMHDDSERLACYLFDTPEPVLVECGPSVTLSHLTDALDELGIDDLAAIVVTHIHLDHAGGAGHLAQKYPMARIGVHSRGARHLVDPAKLLASATRIYGEDGMARLWGSMEPIDEDRLMILEEGTEIPLGGGRSLDVMYTPGHAKHHVVYVEAETGGCFVGDSVGLAFPHGHMVQPLTPPPDLDPHVLVEQLHRMAARRSEFLGLAHFGIEGDPAATLAAAEERLWDWIRFIEGLGNLEVEAAAARLREWTLDGYRAEGHSEDLIATYDKNSFWPVHVGGIQRWLSLQR